MGFRVSAENVGDHCDDPMLSQKLINSVVCLAKR